MKQLNINSIVHTMAIKSKEEYYQELKGKYFLRLFVGISKLIPEEFEELWSSNATIIKQALKKISKKGEAVVFKEGDRHIVATEIVYKNIPKFPDLSNKWALVQYFDSFSTANVPKFKLLTNQNKDWIFIHNDNLDDKGLPLPDVSIHNEDESYQLNKLKELAANTFLMAWKSKGITELSINQDDLEKMTVEEFFVMIDTGIFVRKTMDQNNGTNAYSKTFSNNKVEDSVDQINFNNGIDITNHETNFAAQEDKYWRHKGLSEFNKIGTFNAHTKEISEGVKEKNKALYEKLIHIGKNIGFILNLISGKKNLENKFEFDLKEIEAPAQQPNPNQNENGEEGVKNNEETTVKTEG